MFFLSSLVKQTPIYPFVGEDASSILYSSFRMTFFKKALGNSFLASKEQFPSNLLFLKKYIYKKRKIC